MKIHGNTVLVTGGRSGIGLAIAQAFANLGNRVLINGRDPQKLAEAKRINPDFHIFTCDITKPDQVDRMFGAIAEQFGGLNELVNNAGIVSPSDFLLDERTLLKAQQEIETNLLGTLRVTKTALPLLLHNSDAAVMTISSILGVVPMPGAAVYSATKAALHSFSISLRHRLQGTRVRVFEVMPPTVDTELARDIGGGRLSPRAVAEAVVAGFQKETYEIRMGPAKALYAVHRISPGLAERVLRRATTVSNNSARSNRPGAPPDALDSSASGRTSPPRDRSRA
jgi:short-subunit dehydrogenase involved in D-alanine esterification of teichoic acids